jgi:hypothetical protein
VAIDCRPQAAQPLQKNLSTGAWPSYLYRVRATLIGVPTSVKLMHRALQIDYPLECRDGNNQRNQDFHHTPKRCPSRQNR